MLEYRSRRALLATLGAGAFAGCFTDGEDESDAAAPAEENDAVTDERNATSESGESPDEAIDIDHEPPDECPKTQELDVEWPETFDASTVGPFVEAYEERYSYEVVHMAGFEYETETRLDSSELSVSVADGPTEAGDGYVIELSGGGPIYFGDLYLGAAVAEPPPESAPIPVTEIDDETVSALVREAPENGLTTLKADRATEGDKIDRFVDVLAALSEADEPISRPGDQASVYVDVDGTTVELSASTTRYHADVFSLTPRYYVDDRVVRRTDDEETDPWNGDLLECRTPE